MNPFFSLKLKLSHYETPPFQRPFNEDVERRLRRLTTSKAWVDYLDMVDAQVNLLSEQMLTAPPEQVSHIVAEIRGVRTVPEKLTQILRGIEHERRRHDAANAVESERKSRGAFFASPFWRSDAS